jgi:hypothetical protein
VVSAAAILHSSVLQVNSSENSEARKIGLHYFLKICPQKSPEWKNSSENSEEKIAKNGCNTRSLVRSKKKKGSYSVTF